MLPAIRQQDQRKDRSSQLGSGRTTGRPHRGDTGLSRKSDFAERPKRIGPEMGA